MTANTAEAERAEFERTIGVDYDLTPSTIRQGQYAVPVTQAAWYGWQAARSAPAVPVPQGWKLVPKEATPEMLEQVWYLGYDEMRDAYCVLVAAAPQPPEADHIPDAGKMVAEVQMPEPEWWVNYCAWTSKETAGRIQESELASAPLYTEQQVRQLLAAHGIEAAP